MSSDTSRNAYRPLKPSLASTRTARTPVTPRVAANATASTKSSASSPAPSVRSEPPTPRARQVNTPINDVLAAGNITPRSSARTSKSGSANASPTSSTRPRSIIAVAAQEKSSGSTLQERGQPARPRSFVRPSSRVQSPLIRSPGLFNLPSPSQEDSGDSQFFHASDAAKQELAPKKPEPPKKAHFFHADGKQEANDRSIDPASPVLSAMSDHRLAGPWARSEDMPHPSVSPHILSSTSSAVSSTSPFFAASATQTGRQPSPSQSKENIHLSYRKGVSQILGTRPTPASRSTVSSSVSAFVERQGNSEPSTSDSVQHHRSPSLSSIDSGNSLYSRRKSSTLTELQGSPLQPVQETQSISIPRRPQLPAELPSIHTSLQSPGVLSRTESGLSPTKAISELAAEARRERKVLDLEISNNSLLSINTALEREVRRQKAELKRFRRLSRAGRFSFAPGERMRSLSADLTALNEEDEDDDDDFGFPYGSLDEVSDDEESVGSSADPLSPSAEDRLAKDERRLRVDLEKHKELLVQSQAMNQSIKRCMYATEDMLQEGKKALEYRVRVSDVKLGGRVLSTHGDQDIEVEDDMKQNGDLKQASGVLETWTNVGPPSIEGSEGGDRDSGIDVDRHPTHALPSTDNPGTASKLDRRPGLGDTGRFMSFSHNLDDSREDKDFQDASV